MFITLCSIALAASMVFLWLLSFRLCQEITFFCFFVFLFFVFFKYVKKLFETGFSKNLWKIMFLLLTCQIFYETCVNDYLLKINHRI